MPGSPAAKAGLRAGDVISKLNNQPVTDANSVQKAVEDAQVGGNLQMELRRNGQTFNLALRPGVFPAQQIQ
jgi:S1-C subfamily serine protease